MLHQGGPQVRSLAKTALETTDTARRDALTGADARDTPLGAAAQQDWNASPPPAGFETAQEQRWLAVINKFSYQSGVPEFDTAMRQFIRNSDHRTYDALDSDIVPRANTAATDKVKALVTEQKTSDRYLVALRQWQVDLGALYGESPVDMTEIALRMSADDARMFLQYGGFAKDAPVADSAEFRQEVESLKARWAGCDYRNPADPYRALVDVTSVAQAEWQAELDAQAAPRNAIVAAEAQAWKDMFDASTALTESVGQAWIADRMLAYQKSMGSTWTPPAAFTTALKGTQTAIDQQLVIANNALTSVKAQSGKADAAQEQAAQIAAANHTPRGRGLAYALQSVQVTKAAVAATEAAAKAIATAKKTSLATTATSSALFAQACAEENALQAQFRRAASEEAAKQAKAAADAAVTQVAVAKAGAEKAASGRARAEAAEKVAKAAAADAHAKRGIAEQEQRNAAAARARADQERAKAAEAERRAEQQRSVAATARTNAETAGTTAAQKRAAAEKSEADAVNARRDAVTAEHLKDAAVAKAQAANAKASADEGTANAQAARKAADEAQVYADQATTAATSARSAADSATAAASAARAAATQATAAAGRARAASDAAQADAVTTSAQAAIAHAAAADAIAGSAQAAGAVRAAQAEVRKAQAASVAAAADAAAAKVLAREAQVDAGKSAGWAYAASVAAVGARDAAAAVVNPANTAIAIGTAYREIDASAGMAVLIGQNAKTLAEQQAATAQIRAAEAARAATAAQQAADRAAADSKAAAVAAAQAAADVSRALAALQQTKVYAAQAATDMAAAIKADASTSEYNRQAQEDAAAADRAATTAEADAAAAREAASAAEADAQSARAAANAAEADAAIARDVAAKADKDADAAELAAANAREAAEQAESAKVLAEIEARNNAFAVAISGEGPSGAAGLQIVPNIRDEVTPDDDCVIPWNDINVCDLKVDHHITGQITYLVRTCPDQTATSCPDAYTIDYLGVGDVDIHETRTERIDVGAIRRDLMTKFAYGMVSDFVECARAEKPNWKTACAWALGSIAAPAVLKVAARSVMTLRVAMRTGIGIEEAYAAVRLAEVEASALAKLEGDAAKALAEKGCATGHSFAADTPVRLAGGGSKPIDQVREGDRVTGIDPVTGGPATGTVSWVHEHTDTDLRDVTVRDAAGDEFVVRTTHNHPFWRIADLGWVDAGDLKVDDALRTEDGRAGVVTDVRPHPGHQQMYDLTVDDIHTYYVVAGASALLVHNVDCLGRKVNWLSTALGTTAMEFRRSLPFYPSRNVAVAKVEVDGQERLLKAMSDGEGKHSEDFIIEQINKLRGEGKEVSKIKELYSDRTPCPRCEGRLGDYLADDADVTWSFYYLDPATPLGAEVNKQTLEMLKKAVTNSWHP
ncbi:hypothetical protein GCM10020358_62390 [Amorphoplanes nipponensis]|uniref:Hint domain-containing protein n=1 Tax=Actinoplanes nipponensis TaxID=135950 RepID=A0A919JJL7_9ACTN|nr:polymorphic toxin-type HINT domain-containing protein [Actinoplanes nipponensis]GIE51973.1 hypothetical protein Ani05nite_55070 [Actinoplanes nipponensis]